jgi:hypothetical protein
MEHIQAPVCALRGRARVSTQRRFRILETILWEPRWGIYFKAYFKAYSKSSYSRATTAKSTFGRADRNDGCQGEGPPLPRQQVEDRNGEHDEDRGQSGLLQSPLQVEEVCHSVNEAICGIVEDGSSKLEPWSIRLQVNQYHSARSHLPSNPLATAIATSE